MTFAWLLVCVLCFAVGLFLLWRARGMRQRSGLPVGEVVYVDTGAWARCEQPLFSNRYRLTGRPDYVVRHQGKFVPVEIKSATGVKQPYDSHVLQLWAYCLLLEENERQAPPFGFLSYPAATFRIPYTPQARAHLLEILTRLRADLYMEDVPRSHSDPHRCQHCGFRLHCSQSL